LSVTGNKPADYSCCQSAGKIGLQTAIVILGLKLNANQLVQISADYSLLVTVYVLTTISLGLTLGYVLGNESKSSQLISSGTAICGGTTIASLSPVIKAKPEQTAVALTLVFLLNAIALFSYPQIGQYLHMTQEQFGIWCALSIHHTSYLSWIIAIQSDPLLNRSTRSYSIETVSRVCGPLQFI
jgi:uncharacterized membrane protein YadS